MNPTHQPDQQAMNRETLRSTRRQALLAGAAAVVTAGAVPSALAQAGAASSATAATQFVEVDGRRLAYRSVGQGKPLVLFHRFRGVLGSSSGFQSDQFRRFEFMLGLKDDRFLRFHVERPAAHAALQAALVFAQHQGAGRDRPVERRIQGGVGDLERPGTSGLFGQLVADKTKKTVFFTNVSFSDGAGVFEEIEVWVFHPDNPDACEAIRF